MNAPLSARRCVVWRIAAAAISLLAPSAVGAPDARMPSDADASTALPDVTASWSLRDRVAGAQLSSFNKRWSNAWLFLDAVRLADVRRDLGGIIVPSARGGRLVLRYEGPPPELENWGNELRVGEPRGTLTIVDRSPGRIVFDAPPETTLFLRTDSGPDAFTLTPIEHERDHERLVWYPELARKIASGAVLRAVHMQQTNWWYGDDATAAPEWDERTTPSDTRQSGSRGIAYELLIDLANRADVDLWLCVPHSANDEYVAALAALVRGELRPQRRVFIEVGNEVWNAIPPYEPQRRWMTAEADRRGILQDLDDYARGVILHAIRTVEVGRVFEQTLGDERTIVVLAQQIGMDWFHNLAAERLGPQRIAHVEALAIAPYFGHSAGPMLGEASDGEIFAELERSLDETLREASRSADAAERHGWPLIAYEGGQHMVALGGFDASDDARLQLKRLNESQRMGELYQRWLEGWSDAGGGLMMHYGLIYQQDGVWGAWGLFDTTDQTHTPKSRAYFDWAAFPDADP